MLSILPSAPPLLNLLRRVLSVLAAPCACRGFGGPNLLKLRKSGSHSLFDEPATLPGGYEMPHFVEKGVFENYIHACHAEISKYTQECTLVCV